MHFAFTQEERLFQGTVREMLKKECTPDVVRAAWDAPAVKTHVWGKLGEMGVLGVTVPEVLGGLGQDELALVLILEETGRAALPDPIVETIAVAVPLLSAAGEKGEAWLRALAAGELRVGVGIDPERYVVNADACDLLLVESPKGGLFALTPEEAKLARHASVDGARRLFDVSVPSGREPLLPPGHAAIAEAWDRGALGSSAQLLGLAQHMLDLTVAYVKVREQFGKPIGSFQAVKHHLADALLALEFARPVVYRAAYSIAHADADRAVHVSMAKAFASDAAETVARAALQCHGAIGYAFEHDLHLWMKRAWALARAWGDAAWHRDRVGAGIFALGGL